LVALLQFAERVLHHGDSASSAEPTQAIRTTFGVIRNGFCVFATTYGIFRTCMKLRSPREYQARKLSIDT
jgi:hypothetical protein